MYIYVKPFQLQLSNFVTDTRDEPSMQMVYQYCNKDIPKSNHLFH